MVEQGGGAIINTSSFAFLGDYGGTGYPAGKGGVNGLTLAIAAELKEHGVRANVVCPGAKTRLSTGSEYESHIVGLNRRGLLDEVSAQTALDAPPPEYAAPIYAYLASNLAKDMTGQNLHRRRRVRRRVRAADPRIIGYRDHHDSPPWSVSEIHARSADRRPSEGWWTVAFGDEAVVESAFDSDGAGLVFGAGASALRHNDPAITAVVGGRVGQDQFSGWQAKGGEQRLAAGYVV